MNAVSSNEVRAWAVNKGLLKAEVNIGRLPHSVAEAFNKSHKSKSYDPKVKPARTIAVKVQVENSRGAKITKTVRVDAAELRKGLKAEGQRGRVNGDEARAFVIGKGLV